VTTQTTSAETERLAGALVTYSARLVRAVSRRTAQEVPAATLRLLSQLEELERAGGLRIAVVAGVVACPEHGTDAEELLRKADAAMWRARAVGQPVGVGALQDR